MVNNLGVPKKYWEYKINTISQNRKKKRTKYKPLLLLKTHTLIEFKENKQGKPI